MAFFPCTRFEDQIVMGFQGCLNQMQQWTDKQRLEYDLKLHEELHELYELVTMMALISIERGLPMVIENPCGTQHYLTRYWGIKPSLIDKNRLLRGDYYKKPTQYWFLNIEPQHNFIFEPMIYHDGRKSIEDTHNKVERSMISPQYANRFIREQLLIDSNG